MAGNGEPYRRGEDGGVGGEVERRCRTARGLCPVWDVAGKCLNFDISGG